MKEKRYWFYGKDRIPDYFILECLTYSSNSVLSVFQGFGWVRWGADPDRLAEPCPVWIWCTVIGLMECSCVSEVRDLIGVFYILKRYEKDH